MANVKEIVQLEGERSEPGQYRCVHLWHEGSFLRAYDWSAWLLCHYVHEFKVTRRQFKGIEQPVVFVGFPQTSLPKFVPEGCDVLSVGEKHSVIELPLDLSEEELAVLREEYVQWCEAQPLAESQQKERSATRTSAVAAHPTSLTEIMHTILAFPVERKSPIDCMLFLTEVKGQLAMLI